MEKKGKVLKVMESDHLNTNKAKILIEDEEWKLLKMFADELLAFREATQVFSKSKSITSPNVSGLYGLLVERLDSLIFVLHHPLQDFTGTKMSNDQAKALRHIHVNEREIVEIRNAGEEKAYVPYCHSARPLIQVGTYSSW